MKLSSLNRLRTKDEVRWLEINSNLIKEKNDFDVNGVSRYLAEMSASEHRTVSSLLIILMMHKLKNKYQSKKKSRSWDLSISHSMINLEEIFVRSKTLYNYALQNFDYAYDKAVKKASAETGLPINSFPDKCEWTMEEILSPQRPL